MESELLPLFDEPSSPPPEETVAQLGKRQQLERPHTFQDILADITDSYCFFYKKEVLRLKRELARLEEANDDAKKGELDIIRMLIGSHEGSACWLGHLRMDLRKWKPVENAEYEAQRLRGVWAQLMGTTQFITGQAHGKGIGEVSPDDVEPQPHVYVDVHGAFLESLAMEEEEAAAAEAEPVTKKQRLGPSSSSEQEQ